MQRPDKTIGKKLSAFWKRDSRGVAAIEFAVSLATLIPCLLGVVEVTQLVRADMSLRHTTEAFAKMVGQQTTAPLATLQDLCTGASQMMYPFAATGFGASVVDVTNVGGSPTQQAPYQTAICSQGGTAVGNAAQIAQGLEPNTGDSAIVVNGTYQYQPLFSLFIQTSFTLSQVVVTRPRIQTALPLN